MSDDPHTSTATPVQVRGPGAAAVAAWAVGALPHPDANGGGTIHGETRAVGDGWLEVTLVGDYRGTGPAFDPPWTETRVFRVHVVDGRVMEAVETR